jgi:hypothetical protein
VDTDAVVVASVEPWDEDEVAAASVVTAALALAELAADLETVPRAAVA